MNNCIFTALLSLLDSQVVLELSQKVYYHGDIWFRKIQFNEMQVTKKNFLHIL